MRLTTSPCEVSYPIDPVNSCHFVLKTLKLHEFAETAGEPPCPPRLVQVLIKAKLKHCPLPLMWPRGLTVNCEHTAIDPALCSPPVSPYCQDTLKLSKFFKGKTLLTSLKDSRKFWKRCKGDNKLFVNHTHTVTSVHTIPTVIIVTTTKRTNKTSLQHISSPTDMTLGRFTWRWGWVGKTVRIWSRVH